MKTNKIIYSIFILIFLVGTLSFISAIEGVYKGTSIDISSIGSGDFSRIATNNTFIFGNDGTFNRVYKLFQNGTSTGTYFSAGSLGSVSGLTTNNTFIWVMTGTSNCKIYTYWMNGTNTTNYFQSGTLTGDARSITNDNTYFYLLYGSFGNSVKVFFMNGTYTGNDYPITGQIPSGVGAGRGITTNNTFIWITDSNAQYVYKYFMNMTYTGTGWNTSSSGNTAPTSITMNDTTFFVRDNVNKSIYEYYVNYIDITPPYFTTIPANASITYGNNWSGVQFIATDNIALGNYSVNDSGFTINQSGFLNMTNLLAAGQYMLNISISDISNNINWTIYNLTINKATGQAALLFNDTAGNITLTYLQQINASASSASGQTINLTRNTTVINTENNIFQALGVGYYKYDVNAATNQNYTAVALSRYLTINKNQENCQVLFNETSPLEYTNSFLVWSNCSTPVVLMRNGTTIVNNSEQRLSTSAYNFSFTRNDTQNYTYIFNQSQFIIRDTTAPVLTIVNPINGQSFTVGTINLNYLVSDAGVGLDRCWYQNGSSGVNKTITCGVNTTISQISDGTYTIYMWSNDTNGNLATDHHIWTISSNAPAINLRNPVNNQYFNTGNNTNFNFTATDGNGISSCQLWTNITRNWSINQTLTNVISAQESNFNQLNLVDNYYIWNTWCNDTTGLGGTDSWATLNNSFTIDTIYPFINITNINSTAGSQTIVFSNNITDTNLLSCAYSIFNSTGNIDGTNLNVPFICGADTSATTTDYGTYNLTLYATDRAGNQYSYWSSYTISPIGVIIITGSSGGTGVIPQIRSWYMSTEVSLATSAQAKTFQLSMLPGGSRDKYLYFYNNGTANRTITLTCEGSICDNIFFSQNNFILPPGIDITNAIKMSIILSNNITKGDYTFNVIATDEYSQKDLITVTVSIGTFGFFTEFVNKITSNKTIFGLQVPYVLILLLIIIVLSALLYLILQNKSWGLQASIIIGLIGGLIIVYFL
jgi:hypothetical protein